MVDLFLVVGRMCQFLGHLSVVGEEQYPCGMTVESSHRIDAFGAGLCHKQHNGFTFFRVIGGGYVILGLVQQEVDFALILHALTVIPYIIAVTHLGPHLGNYLAIDRDKAGRYQVVCLSSGTDSGGSYELIQPDQTLT